MMDNLGMPIVGHTIPMPDYRSINVALQFNTICEILHSPKGKWDLDTIALAEESYNLTKYLILIDAIYGLDGFMHPYPPNKMYGLLAQVMADIRQAAAVHGQRMDETTRRMVDVTQQFYQVLGNAFVPGFETVARRMNAFQASLLGFNEAAIRAGLNLANDFVGGIAILQEDQDQNTEPNP